MNEKIKLNYIKFSTELGEFLLLDTNSENDYVEVVLNMVYVKRTNKLFETAIRPEPKTKVNLLGKLKEIEHHKIFDSVLKYNLIEYQKNPMFLWKSLDSIFNSQNVTILAEHENEFKFYQNPYLLSIKTIK